MALSRHELLHRTCPLSGVERTWPCALQMSAYNPKRTWATIALAAWSQSATLFLGGHLQRREFITLLGGAAAAWPLTAGAQQAQKVGFLYPGPVTASSARIAAFIEGLRSAGFRVPEQIDVIARIADGDPARLAPLAAELIEQKPDVIVTVGSAAVRIVHSATTTIPIVAHDLDTDLWPAGSLKVLGTQAATLRATFLASHNFG